MLSQGVRAKQSFLRAIKVSLSGPTIDCSQKNSALVVQAVGLETLKESKADPSSARFWQASP